MTREKEEPEHMTEREMRRSEYGFAAGMFLTGAAVAAGVIWLLGMLFNP